MQTITIIDAREVDGTPYEAAEAAVREAERALAATDKALEAAFVLARNAGLQRQIDLDGSPDPAAWTGSLEAARIIQASEQVRMLAESLRPVRQAVAFDPANAA